MPEFDLHALATALADHPRADAFKALTEAELRRRLQRVADRPVGLTPAGLHPHRIADLLRNLSHLRPEPRAVFFNRLLKLLDLSHPDEKVRETGDLDAIPVPPPAPGPPAADADPPRRMLTPSASPPPLSAIDQGLSQFKQRPPDLFDRFLDWVAAVMHVLQ